MANAFSVSIDIAASPAEVWAVIGADQVPRWYSQYTASVTHGDIRTLTRADGSQVVERLLARDEERRWYSYSVVSGVPLRSHFASFEVADDGAGGARVIWHTEGEPLEEGQDLETRLADRQRAALEGLRALFTEAD